MILSAHTAALSYHAIVRYCERALGIDTAPYRAHDDYMIVHNMAADGYDMAGLAEAILSPAVRLAIRLGASAVRIGNFKFLIRDGVVVSCHTKWMRSS